MKRDRTLDGFEQFMRHRADNPANQDNREQRVVDYFFNAMPAYFRAIRHWQRNDQGIVPRIQRVHYHVPEPRKIPTKPLERLKIGIELLQGKRGDRSPIAIYAGLDDIITNGFKLTKPLARMAREALQGEERGLALMALEMIEKYER